MVFSLNSGNHFAGSGLSSFYFISIFKFFGYVACGVLVPQPGIEPVLPPMEAES